METTPKVHRHRRHHRSNSRHRTLHEQQQQQERQPQPQPQAQQQHQQMQQSNLSSTTTGTTQDEVASHTRQERPQIREDGNVLGYGVAAMEEGCLTRNSSEGSSSSRTIVSTETATVLNCLHECTDRPNRGEKEDSNETLATTPSNTSQCTMVLVNGHVPPENALEGLAESEMLAPTAITSTKNTDILAKSSEIEEGVCLTTPHIESPTQQQAAGSSRNSSGDALSLRETLQQLPPTVTAQHRHHRRSQHSPQTSHEVDSAFHRGILGFMDRELKQCSPTPSALSAIGSQGSGGGGGCGGGGGGGSGGWGSGTTRKLQSLSDPQASPAQRSIRSRSSLEKSPRRKRSKSESRRRRERKLIAAGEMEVRQANETLMRYLKQCSEMNDASLSGELEIDQNYDERRVHRKTKSQRNKRGHLISKLYTAGGLSSILKELSDDIVPAEGEEIYNPFTPVVSPTDDAPAHIDKMFLQTSSGYRPVEHCYYKYSFVGAHGTRGVGEDVGGGSGGASAGGRRLVGPHSALSASYCAEGRDEGGDGGPAGLGGIRGADACCLLNVGRYGRPTINSNIALACVIQRIWLFISNICHGLLAGLALAHLLFVLTSNPMNWTSDFNDISLMGEALKGDTEAITTTTANTITDPSIKTPPSASPTDLPTAQLVAVLKDYAAFAEIYLNNFYCLAILCLVSVLDRMDICCWQLSNATETISFRWLIIAMIYVATIILTICSNSIDEKLYFNNNANVTMTQSEMLSKNVLNVWSSLSVTRSIGALCGWFMIGLSPHEDLLYEHLVDLTSHQLTN